MKLNLEIVGGPTWVLTVDGKLKIGCDPALAPEDTKYFYKGMASTRVVGPVYTDTTFAGISIWLITHNHFDHIDKAGAAKIENDSCVVSRKECSRFFKPKPGINVSYLDWMDEKTIHLGEYAVQVCSLPAYHGMNSFAHFLLGKVSGYLLTVTRGIESRSLYITGDTVYHSSIIKSLGGRNVDYIIANLGNIKPKMFGGPFIMDTTMLERFSDELKPKKTVPVHINDYSHFSSTPEEVGEKFEVPKLGAVVSL